METGQVFFCCFFFFCRVGVCMCIAVLCTLKPALSEFATPLAIATGAGH